MERTLHIYMAKWMPNEMLKQSRTKPNWSSNNPPSAEEPGEPQVAPSVYYTLWEEKGKIEKCVIWM